MSREIENKLKQMHSRFLFKKMSIQFFGEGDDNGNGGDDGSGGTPPKTYSEEEYQKLKNSLDKALKEVADAKKRERDKMTDDEKKAAEQEAINQRIKDYESKIEDFELKEELMKANVFSSEEIESIVSKKTSSKELLNEMVKIFSTKIENAKKQAVQEFMQSSDVTGSGGSGKDKQDPDVANFIESSKKNSATKASSFKCGYIR